MFIIGTCYRLCKSSTESANATVLAKGNSSNDNLENNLLDLLELGGSSGIKQTWRQFDYWIALLNNVGRQRIVLLLIITYLRSKHHQGEQAM